ncbi:MAG: proton-conducting transporter membrane subunit, partial [Chloroflexi bacterium]|nr:proton-conducting transporter membrane subunit [Chloroflexota bacterium]
FIFIGLGLKMALVPLHLWLPDAYTFAPSSVNTLIAPIMTKVGAYAMLRMFLSVFPEGYLIDEVPIRQALIVLGAIGVLVGAVVAFRQQDIRRLLAYSSISQLGFIAIGIGLATPLGFVAALLHIMNHALMKGTLFLAVMAIRLQTGVSEVPALAGLGRHLPVTAAAFTVGAIAMVGVPPTVGFFSKWYLSIAAVEQDLWVILAVVLVSSLLSAAYLFRVLERAYFAPPPAAPDGPHDQPEGEARRTRLPLLGATWEPRVDVLLPLVLLAAATIVLGVLNVVVVRHVLEPGT